MKAFLVSVSLVALFGIAVPQPNVALADAPKSEAPKLDLAKCALRRDECATAVRFCLNSGEELTCKQAQYVCERVDPRCPQ
ncbi:MAG: hypothetical protein U1E87_03595 [Alphaproteobacteria bacterium]